MSARRRSIRLGKRQLDPQGEGGLCCSSCFPLVGFAAFASDFYLAVQAGSSFVSSVGVGKTFHLVLLDLVIVCLLVSRLACSVVLIVKDIDGIGYCIYLNEACVSSIYIRKRTRYRGRFGLDQTVYNYN